MTDFSDFAHLGSYNAFLIGMGIPEMEEALERAAIMEYDGGMTRAEAEAKAAEIIFSRRDYGWKNLGAK